MAQALSPANRFFHSFLLLRSRFGKALPGAPAPSDRIPLLRMSEKKSSVVNMITWIVIGITLVLIAAWTVWAGRQADIHSMWALD